MAFRVNKHKTFWVGLKVLIDKICLYYRRYNQYLPPDLPSEVQTFLGLVEAACKAMGQYDLNTRGGEE